MAGYRYPPHTSPPEDEEFNFNQPIASHLAHQQHQAYRSELEQAMMPLMPQQQLYHEPHQFYQPHEHYPQQFGYHPGPTQPWVTPTVPSNYHYDPQPMGAFPSYSEPTSFTSEPVVAGPSRSVPRYLSPDEAEAPRVSRSTSFASNASSVSLSDVSRSASPNANEMAKWGFRNQQGTWSCGYTGCSSRSTFTRGCDLRKHYKRHTKSLFCRHEGCPQATEGGFSSKKDRARHEASHNPIIPCEWEGCERMFSRLDNMKDHVKRMHRRTSA